MDVSYFNIPLKFTKTGDWHSNERMVEYPFVYNNIEFDGKGKKVLEFGCSKSYLALELASLGYEVIGIDLREYPFKYPNFVFKQTNILNVTEKDFDYIISVSVIEHIGCNVYCTENKNTERTKVIDKIYDLLKVGGKLIVTVPVGIQSTDKMLHCFSYDEVRETFKKFKLEKEFFYLKRRYKYWKPCTIEEISNVSNHQKHRKFTGGNSVGCFVFKKV